VPQPPARAASWRKLTQAPFRPDAPPASGQAGDAGGVQTARAELRARQRGERRLLLMGIAKKAACQCRGSAGALCFIRCQTGSRHQAAGADVPPVRRGQLDAEEDCPCWLTGGRRLPRPPSIRLVRTGPARSPDAPAQARQTALRAGGERTAVATSKRGRGLPAPRAEWPPPRCGRWLTGQSASRSVGPRINDV
jgi:hypothetical protein